MLAGPAQPPGANPDPPGSSWQEKAVGMFPWLEANTCPSLGTVMVIWGANVSATWAEAGAAVRPATATVAATRRAAMETRGDIRGMQLEPGGRANRDATLDLADERVPVPAPARRRPAAHRAYGVPRLGARQAGGRAPGRIGHPARGRRLRRARGHARCRRGRRLPLRGGRRGLARSVLALAAGGHPGPVA